MRFFKEIFIKLTNWSSFLFSIEKKPKPNSVMNEKGEKKKRVIQKIDRKKEVVREIVKDPIKESDKVVVKNNSTTSRISELFQTQKDLIWKKYIIKNEKYKKVSVFKREELAFQLEKLKTNLQLQSNYKYTPQPVTSESILNLKKGLIEYEQSTKNLAKTLQENRLIIKSLRNKDKASTIKKREDISKFSLIELFKESERKKEIERIELKKKEEKRIQKLKFDKSIKKAKKLIEAYDFDSAETELKNALSINYLRHKAVNNLKDEILRLKRHFKKEREEFDKVYSRACVQMLNNDYKNALKNFNKSKLFNINIEQVNEKIKLVKDFIQQEIKQQEEYLKEREKFIIEVDKKNFITAKRTLARISEKFESKEIEVQNLQKQLDKSKFNYKQLKIKYKQNLEKAESFYLNNDFISSIRVLKNCLNFNINNEFCEKRIREIEHKVDLDVKKEKLLQKKAKAEKERLIELAKYKEEKDEILQFLRSNGIACFYHFTDESNISSIKLNGGLYSWSFCENNGIEINKPGGGDVSRALDLRYNLQNFVRLSFVKEHPMKYVASRDGRIRSPKVLAIDLETATFNSTLFSNMNATSNNHKVGDNLSFLRDQIKYDVIKQLHYYKLTSEEKPFYQAEIMVEEHVESKYIINL